MKYFTKSKLLNKVAYFKYVCNSNSSQTLTQVFFIKKYYDVTKIRVTHECGTHYLKSNDSTNLCLSLGHGWMNNSRPFWKIHFKIFFPRMD